LRCEWGHPRPSSLALARALAVLSTVVQVMVQEGCRLPPGAPPSLLLPRTWFFLHTSRFASTASLPLPRLSRSHRDVVSPPPVCTLSAGSTYHFKTEGIIDQQRTFSLSINTPVDKRRSLSAPTMPCAGLLIAEKRRGFSAIKSASSGSAGFPGGVKGKRSSLAPPWDVCDTRPRF
jgi:hypothetical protein